MHHSWQPSASAASPESSGEAARFWNNRILNLCELPVPDGRLTFRVAEENYRPMIIPARDDPKGSLGSAHAR
jgi:hypothetical protein